ncbi:MAG: hypothetical protein J3K34DRAFT_526712 [Monoraphidium minutum]|nr:MAG: hypothetical protein J3K34DRAFT_526712 [Monoraphidium minutum]
MAATAGASYGGRRDAGPVIKGGWRPEEDDALKGLVEHHGESNWSTIARHLNTTVHAHDGAGRIGKQCRERWFHHLRPNINKDAWTVEEEAALIEAHRKHGNRWCEIARLMPTRTENSIKNWFNAILRRRTFGAKGEAAGAALRAYMVEQGLALPLATGASRAPGAPLSPALAALPLPLPLPVLVPLSGGAGAGWQELLQGPSPFSGEGGGGGEAALGGGGSSAPATRAPASNRRAAGSEDGSDGEWQPSPRGSPVAAAGARRHKPAPQPFAIPHPLTIKTRAPASPRAAGPASGVKRTCSGAQRAGGPRAAARPASSDDATDTPLAALGHGSPFLLAVNGAASFAASPAVCSPLLVGGPQLGVYAALLAQHGGRPRGPGPGVGLIPLACPGSAGAFPAALHVPELLATFAAGQAGGGGGAPGDGGLLQMAVMQHLAAAQQHTHDQQRLAAEQAWLLHRALEQQQVDAAAAAAVAAAEAAAAAAVAAAHAQDARQAGAAGRGGGEGGFSDADAAEAMVAMLMGAT